MTEHTIHVRKVIVFDYTITGDFGNDMDPDEVRGQLHSELADPIGRAIDAQLEPWDGDTFTMQECVVTVLGDEMAAEDEKAVNAIAAEFLGQPGVQVHRRVS